MTKENNGWISVEERLPQIHPDLYYMEERSDNILLYGINDSVHVPHIFIGYMIEGNIFYSEEFGECKLGNITHWQPPPPTK